MKKSLLTRILVSIFFFIGIAAIIYYLYDRFIYSGLSLSPGSHRIKTEEIADEKQIQYRFKHTGIGNKKQIISLNKGEAFFAFSHKGESNFIVELRNNNDSLIALLVSERGDYNGYKTLNVSENEAFILNVITHGEWEISYK